MNCAEKLLEPTIFFNFFHQVTIEIRFQKSLAHERLSPTWNLESNHRIVYKILKMFCEVYDTDSLV